jgi:deoxyribodipyrimidine photo-lyase
MERAESSDPPPAAARALVWFRRDLRVQDHPALARALREAAEVWCVFVLDRPLLEPLPRADRRVEFIRESLVDLDARLAALARAAGRPGARLIVRHAEAAQEIPRLAAVLDVATVYAHHDDDPAALRRDAQVAAALAARGRRLVTLKDHVVFERAEILTAAGSPYGVFTPYKAAWLKALRMRADALAVHATAPGAAALAPLPSTLRSPWRAGAAVPALAEFGFEETDLATVGPAPGTRGGEALLAAFLDRIDAYDAERDLPARDAPSRLGAHLRFGTLSIRRLVALALERIEGGSRGAQTWLSELVWREFFAQVLHHHPHVVDHAFHAQRDAIAWEEGALADTHFAAWCAGRTGYPFVDAGMRELADTGTMHNRLRMATASFLTKDLGISWRRGEAWFARLLTDYELASNNGNWQWAASTGCDAQPWFRIFNPVTQGERFDPQGAYIRRHVPELAALPDTLIHAPWRARPADLAAFGLVLGRDYPAPLVDHDMARERTLARFGKRESHRATHRRPAARRKA